MNIHDRRTAEPPCNSPVESKPKIQQLLAKEAGLVSTLHEVICSLDNKLTPVLRQESSAPCQGEKPNEKAKSPQLVDVIEDHSRGIDFAISRIEKLISLLEI